MIIAWLIVWALAGQPQIGGWWLVFMVLAAVSTATQGRQS